MKGARRMNPSRSPLVPSWDLSIILAGLQRGPFEPLDSVELKFLSLKTALLTALTSIKRVGDLQAFSVSEECLVFGPVHSHVVLKPRPGYVPKVRSGGEPASTCLLRHSPSPGDTSAFFLLQFSSLDSEPWWNLPSTPGSQTGRSSLTPGPVLVLARPGLRSAPVLG